MYLTDRQLVVLRTLRLGDWLTPSEISKRLGHHASNETREELIHMRRYGYGLVYSPEWGLWAITEKGQIELYAREYPQLELETS